MTDEDLNLAFAMFQKKYFGKLRPCRCWFADMPGLGFFGTFRSVEGYIDGERATHYIRINKKIAWARSLGVHDFIA